MEIQIRNLRLEEYEAVENIMRQVHRMHVDWRPDIYRDSGTALPPEVYRQAIENETAFAAQCGGQVAGVLFIQYRHIENSGQVTRDIIFVDSMGVDEQYRGKGIGHAFFDFLRELKRRKGCGGIELQVNAKNRAAYKMYAAYGFTEKSVNMELL